MLAFRCFLVAVYCNLLIYPFGLTSTSSTVPVFLWETSQFSELVPALAVVNEDEFKKIVQDRSTSEDPVFVFTEETLSTEDFALHDGEGNPIFDSISLLKESAHITYWPIVRNPIAAISQIPNKNIVNTSIKELVDNPSFAINNNDILLIDLKDAMDGEDRLDMLKRHDKDIIEVYKRYAQVNKNIISILTGYRPSWVPSNELRSARKARSAENEVTKMIYKNKELLIYVNSTATLNFKGNSVPLDDFKLVPENEINTDGMNATLKSATYQDITIKLNFNFGGGYWSLYNISVTNGTSDPYSLWIRNVYAPVGFSYHCHGQTFYNMSNSNVNITLPGFQLQVYFNVTEGAALRFGDAYDCVGFMSAPIWSGLFITFLMALIMTFGLSMMMDIKTMDRFDDPKGKTITINAE